MNNLKNKTFCKKITFHEQNELIMHDMVIGSDIIPLYFRIRVYESDGFSLTVMQKKYSFAGVWS